MCVDENKKKNIFYICTPYILFDFIFIFLSTPCDIDFNITNAFKKLTITFSSSGRFQVPAQPRISHAMMAFAYQCAGNVIRSRTAQMDPMRPANVVSIANVFPLWARRRSGSVWMLIAILLVWLFGRKRFWLTAPNDRCWSTRHKMRKSPYQKHQMQLVAHVAACCMQHGLPACCLLHLAPVT